MAITVERRDGGPERTVVIAAVTNKHVLGQLAAAWTPNALPSPYASTIVEWAVTHYKEYRSAPGLTITDYFEEWRPTADKDTVALVERLLTTLSDDYRRLRDNQPPPEYVLSRASELMLATRLAATARRVSEALERGDPSAAAAEMSKYRPISVGSSAWVDFSDTPSMTATIAATRESRGKPLVQYPGALGEFFGRSLERDAFVAFLGGEKCNKSFWIQDLVWRARLQGRHVAYFEAGDLSKGQVIDRFIVRAAGRPLSGSTSHPVSVPSHIESPSGRGSLAHLEHERVWFRSDMTDDERAAVLRPDTPGSFRLAVHANSTLSVPGIESQLVEWDKDGWTPDVICIDYADIMAPTDRRLEGLDRINETWKALRGLSQKHNCLVVTATQARRGGPAKWLMDREDIADDKRKLGHVTAMFGINRTEKEISAGIWRLNPIGARDLALHAGDCVYTAGCLDIGNPAVLSTF